MSSRDYCAHWWEHCRCRTTRRKETVDHRWAPIHHRLSSTRPTWRPTLWYHRRRPATETKKRRRRRRPKSWNFCRPSFQAIISPGHEIFSPPQRDENIHFPLEKEKKNFHDTNSPCSKPGLLHATRAKWISALYEHSRPRILRLRCNLQGEPDVSQRHRPIPGVLPK